MVPRFADIRNVPNMCGIQQNTELYHKTNTFMVTMQMQFCKCCWEPYADGIKYKMNTSQTLCELCTHEAQGINQKSG